LLGTALIRDNQIDRRQKIIDRILRSPEVRFSLYTAREQGENKMRSAPALNSCGWIR